MEEEQTSKTSEHPTHVEQSLRARRLHYGRKQLFNTLKATETKYFLQLGGSDLKGKESVEQVYVHLRTDGNFSGFTVALLGSKVEDLVSKHVEASNMCDVMNNLSSINMSLTARSSTDLLK